MDTVIATLSTGWPVVGFVLHEALDEPCRIEVTVELDPDDTAGLVDVQMVFSVGRKSGPLRDIPCLIDEVIETDDDNVVVLVLRSRIWVLHLTERSRIFADRTSSQILQRMLVGLGPGAGIHNELGDGVLAPVARDYQVQYRESSLSFVQRILARDGIGFFLGIDDRDRETVTLFDRNDVLGEPHVLDVSEQVQPDEDAVTSVRRRQGGAPPGDVFERVWDWQSRPRVLRPLEIGHLPEVRGTRVVIDEGRERLDQDAAVMRGRAALEAERWSLQTTWPLAAPGRPLELAGSRYDGQKLLIVAVVHRSGERAERAGEFVGYANEVEATRLDVPYLPRLRPRPHITGPQPAVVIGAHPAGPDQPAHPEPDEFGRICVQMLWDDLLGGDHCRIRVASPWAGDGFGWHFVPRVGTEVVVEFFHGDPERPVCTGCLYGGASPPPHPPLDHPARGTLRSQCLADDKAYHEIRFDDDPGDEKLLIHAHRLLRETVSGSRSASVTGNASWTVSGNASTSVGKNAKRTVSGSDEQTIQADQAISVGAKLSLRVSADKKATSKGLEISVEQASAVLSAADSIELRCGDSEIVITPDEVKIVANRVVLEGSNSYMSLKKNAVHVESPSITANGRSAFLVLTEFAELSSNTAGSIASVTCDGGTTTVLGDVACETKAPVVDVAATTAVKIEGPQITSDGESLTLTGGTVGIAAKADGSMTAGGDLVVRGTKVKIN